MGSLSGQNTNQSNYVSELFHCTYVKNIHAYLDTKPHNNIYATYDSALFVINQRGFGKEGEAKIYKINAFSGVEDTYSISLPPTFKTNRGKIERIWVWAIAVADSILCLAVDEGIWVYHYTASKQCEYLKTILIADVSDMQFVNQTLHTFIPNNEGFEWVKIHLSNNEIEYVRSLVLNNHFFLQIAPVKLITISSNALYFLQRNEPIIEKYALNGEHLAAYALKIPNWENISKEVAHKLDSIEDITERNYAFSKFSVFEHNFMHLFYAFSSERFFMIAMDSNKSAETYITPYFIQIIGDTTIIEPYSVKLNENEKFSEKHFPFLTQSAEGNLLFEQLNNYVIQINNGSNLSWQNKTQKEFQRDVNFYHRDNDPIEKIETYHLIKDYIPADSIHFLDFDDHIFSLNEIKNDKAIFIISQYPQCATCTKVIWHYFSNKKMQNVDIYNVAQNCHTYLMKKENIKEVNTFLKAEYVPLFIDTNKLNSATKQILSQKSNPIVLLFDKKLQHIELFSTVNIIGDFMGNLNPVFLHAIDNFMGE